MVELYLLLEKIATKERRSDECMREYFPALSTSTEPHRLDQTHRNNDPQIILSLERGSVLPTIYGRRASGRKASPS